jgi:hypothetical protein
MRLFFDEELPSRAFWSGFIGGLASPVLMFARFDPPRFPDAFDQKVDLIPVMGVNDLNPLAGDMLRLGGDFRRIGDDMRTAIKKCANKHA